MKIYTKKGDEGDTMLIGGHKVKKSHPRIKAYGEVDELNSFIGLAAAEADKEFKEIFLNIQRDLFAIGAQLADPSYDEKNAKKTKTVITEEKITSFEKLIDKFDQEIEPLKSFILPGGSKKASLLHVLRTVTRRAERTVVELETSGDKVPPLIIKYLNRLNDLFFTMARVQNKRDEQKDIPWT